MERITRIDTRTSVTCSNCKRGENLRQNTNADHNSIAVARSQTVTRQFPSSSPNFLSVRDETSHKMQNAKKNKKTENQIQSLKN